MKKLIVLSADALVSEDLEYLASLPNFKKYLAGGCRVNKVKSVYPTITYPCHTTMITGVYPGKHRVTGNFELHPGQVSDLPWMWDHKYNKWKEDIFTEAKKAGYTTAAVFWPVTGNHPCIDYLIDEYWEQSSEDTPCKAFERMGSKAEMLEIIDRHAKGEVEPVHPRLDAFIINCAADIIRQYKPDILFVHPANIDAARHKCGLFNKYVLEAIEETDNYIGQLMEAAKEAGMTGEVNLVLTSDHGQMEIKRAVNLNVILAEYGLIRTGEDGSLEDWDAWCMSGGMSAMVYLKNPEDGQTYGRTYGLLKSLAEEGVFGISRVFTREEAAREEQLDGDFSFVLESDDFTSFGDRYTRPLATKLGAGDYRLGYATHGYLPQKGPQPVFLAKGPDFRENTVLDQARLIDEAPTFAKLLGIELKAADGNALDVLLR